MSELKIQQMEILCDYLRSRRNAILLAWRKAVSADSEQTTARSLTRGQFNDHIPEVLDAFERRLRSRPGGTGARAANVEQKQEEVKHGLHRWQQGYRLQELMREWGHLQLCLFEELNAFAAAHPTFERETLVEANREMITMANEAISESTAQYERMQQAEAAGRVEDLHIALAGVHEVERRRSNLIHQAVHDLNGDVFGVSVAAHLLSQPDTADAARERFSTLLSQGIDGVTAMLGELMELSRLEAGQEQREIAEFDVAELVIELGDVSRPIASERHLFLDVRGPDHLIVEGDCGKVRRLLQNLLRNALKYTERGGVVVSWGEEPENWWLKVEDTGPGMPVGPNGPLTTGLQEATASARESDEKAAAAEGEASQVLTPTGGTPSPIHAAHQQPGEGIGLSIVKRLCELLDASLELASSAETGTTFRVVLPRSYPAPAAPT